jgi:hypothetical protein
VALALLSASTAAISRTLPFFSCLLWIYCILGVDCTLKLSFFQFIFVERNQKFCIQRFKNLRFLSILVCKKVLLRDKVELEPNRSLFNLCTSFILSPFSYYIVLLLWPLIKLVLLIGFVGFEEDLSTTQVWEFGAGFLSHDPYWSCSVLLLNQVIFLGDPN